MGKVNETKTYIELNNGTEWPYFGEIASQACWKARHDQQTLSRHEIMYLASMAIAYVELIDKNSITRNKVCSEIKRAMKGK